MFPEHIDVNQAKVFGRAHGKKKRVATPAGQTEAPLTAANPNADEVERPLAAYVALMAARERAIRVSSPVAHGALAVSAAATAPGLAALGRFSKNGSG